ncbi:MAG: twin-arginine translocation signal domain-containing protein [Desulfobacterales bacterium]|nr:twin-arginine translocation signal domain-containing protein [Desulfobacterales bacterium]
MESEKVKKLNRREFLKNTGMASLAAATLRSETDNGPRYDP